MLLSNKYELDGMDKSLYDTFLKGSQGRAKFYFKDEFRLLKVIDENEMIFIYLGTGRINHIKARLKKEGDTLFVTVFEAPLLWSVPMFLFVIGMVSLLMGSAQLGLYVFIGSLLSLLLFYFFFHSYSKNIKKSLEKFMRT